MDSKAPQKVLEFEMHPDRGFVLLKGIGYLMHTAERVRTGHYVPVLDGKSSIGRLFIAVHVTAGYGDTGFDGQYTLEVTAQHPVVVYPGMRFCQIRFHTTVGDVQPYHGNYTGEASMGPVPSRAYNQFK
jgi:dCTP deaminase